MYSIRVSHLSLSLSLSLSLFSSCYSGTRRFLPFCSRLCSTFLPFALCIRFLNPCRLFRTKLLGWYVLLMRKTPRRSMAPSSIGATPPLALHANTASSSRRWKRCHCSRRHRPATLHTTDRIRSRTPSRCTAQSCNSTTQHRDVPLSSSSSSSSSSFTLLSQFLLVLVLLPRPY